MKQPQHIPELFHRIVENDHQRTALRQQAVVPFAAYKLLSNDRRTWRKMAAWNLSRNPPLNPDSAPGAVAA